MWLLWVCVYVIARSICITVGDWVVKMCPLYGIERCPFFRGCFTIGVYGATIRTWESVHYKGGVRSSEVSVKRGSTVHMSVITHEQDGGSPLMATAMTGKTDVVVELLTSGADINLQSEVCHYIQ